jgi:hypothetical protein
MKTRKVRSNGAEVSVIGPGRLAARGVPTPDEQILRAYDAAFDAGLASTRPRFIGRIARRSSPPKR